MRNTLSVLAGTALVLALILVLIRQPEKAHIGQLDFIDLTSIDRISINADELYDAMGFNTNKWQSAEIRIVPLTDISITEVRQASISAAKPLYSNEYEREDQIAVFKSTLQELINKANTDTGGRQQSELYIPIAVELNQWIKENKDISGKRVNIFSDMYQYSSWFSVYNPAHYYLLQSDPEGTYHIFQKEVPLPDLSGITIRIIYQPKSVEDDRRFRVVAGFFKYMFEKHGAKVEISATIKS